MRAGEIALIEVLRDGIVSCRQFERFTRPVVVLVGDDDHCSTGPLGWASARGLLHWARAGLVHASSASAASYRAAIDMAVHHRRLLLVETDTAHADEWSEAVLRRQLPCVRVLPTDGGAHPIAPALAS